MIVRCPHCGIGPMRPLSFGYYLCRLVDLKYIPKNIEPQMFNPKCLLMQKLG